VFAIAATMMSFAGLRVPKRYLEFSREPEGDAPGLSGSPSWVKFRRKWCSQICSAMPLITDINAKRVSFQAKNGRKSVVRF